MWNFSTPFFFLFYKFPHKIFVLYLFNLFIISCLCILWKCWHNDCCFIVEEWNIECITKKDSIPTEEPKKEEPKSEAAWVCMSEEPAKTDSVPSQEPKKEDVQKIFSIR